MSDTRPELSLSNPYYIPRHRYYELKHFCLQYPEWKKLYFVTKSNDLNSYIHSGLANPTADLAVNNDILSRKICQIETACRATDEIIGPYILIGVTKGLSFEKLRARYSVPCCKDNYYILYRKFFYELNKLRD